jgi:DNA (cytosine-5)-methyltransferase 1
MRELIVDLFAGGGGASEGIEQALGVTVDIAINHDPEAIKMHKANHPGTKHFIEDVVKVNPLEVVADRPVGLLWASPDCTHFSRAKGGKPVKKEIRSLAWVVVHWAQLVKPRVIILENVPEFKTWGPLGDDNRPDHKKVGKTFNLWANQLRELGYNLDFRELSACDYGTPTIRKRLFMIARCDGQPIIWPEATHGEAGNLFGLKPYHTAAECIDWSIHCPSIFERKKPLAENTLKRIAKGLRKFVIETGNPFVIGIDHQRSNSAVAPFLSKYHGQKAHETRGQKLDEPLKTQDTSNRFALVSAFLTKFYGTNIGSVNEPMHTITSKDRFGLVTVAGQKYQIADIGLRMLAPHELAAAQGFPESYQLIGTKTNQVAKIGNSVCPPIAKALVSANVELEQIIKVKVG